MLYIGRLTSMSTSCAHKIKMSYPSELENMYIQNHVATLDIGMQLAAAASTCITIILMLQSGTRRSRGAQARSQSHIEENNGG